MLIVNDLHLGVKRASGTTLESQGALRAYLYRSFKALIDQDDDDLVINGDLFDNFTVDPQDVLDTYLILHEWVYRWNNRLILIAGNHDWSPRGGKLSSFHLLSSLLQRSFGNRVQVIDADCGLTEFYPGMWAIPHMPNQDLFDLELEKAIKQEGMNYLLLHCNVASTFAEHSDHSLNISWEQMQRIPATLIFGHEHQGRNINGHIVTGNQFPSSVADCLAHGTAQQNGIKRAIVIHDDATHSEVKTWSAEDNYAEVDWRELDTCLDTDFIRVIGSAAVEEAAEVVSNIAQFRARSKSFIVSNAVKVEGIQGMETLTELSFEEVKSFDVLNALLEMLDPKEQQIVKELANATSS